MYVRGEGLYDIIFEALMRGLGFQTAQVLLTQMIRCLLSGTALALIHLARRLALKVCRDISALFETTATY
jgi:hypothetical protein